MFVRVVRFTDVTPDRADATLARIEESGGPPPGISIARLQMLYNAEEQTAVVLQYFETAEEMEASAKVFADMDLSETPGTRATVDTGEMKLDITPS